jgi:hypothetical protein
MLKFHRHLESASRVRMRRCLTPDVLIFTCNPTKGDGGGGAEHSGCSRGADVHDSELAHVTMHACLCGWGGAPPTSEYRCRSLDAMMEASEECLFVFPTRVTD